MLKEIREVRRIEQKAKNKELGIEEEEDIIRKNE